jgi:hypothetical protein
VQPAHSLAQFAIEHHNTFVNWQNFHKNLIVLAVEDEASLSALLMKARMKNVKVSAFREPDIKDQLTAIAMEPCQETYSLTGHLELALKKTG